MARLTNLREITSVAQQLGSDSREVKNDGNLSCLRNANNSSVGRGGVSMLIQ